MEKQQVTAWFNTFVSTSNKIACSFMPGISYPFGYNFHLTHEYCTRSGYLLFLDIRIQDTEIAITAGNKPKSPHLIQNN